MPEHALKVDREGVVRAPPYGQVLGYVDDKRQFQAHQPKGSKAFAKHKWTGTIQGRRVASSDNRAEVVDEIEGNYVAHREGSALHVKRRASNPYEHFGV